ncbi:sphingomyelin phosphodiesterase-like protein 2, partial [Dinothrombium tinctorium]
MNTIFFNPLFFCALIQQDVIDGRASKLACEACKLAFELAKKIASFSEPLLKTLFTLICTLFEIETKQVCNGLLNLYAPQLFFILKHSKLKPLEMCAILVGPKCLPSEEYLRSKCVWELGIPGKRVSTTTNTNEADYIVYGDGVNEVKTVRDVSINWQSTHSMSAQTFAQREVDKILHITDIHLDPNYCEACHAYCEEPLCCMNISNSTNRSILSGYWGSYGNCDIPVQTVEKSLEYLSKMHNFDYIMYTGDTLPHLIWNASKAITVEEIRTLTAILRKYLANSTLFFPVIGNHEGLPVNMFPPPEIENPFSLNWLYDALYEQWQQWICEKSVKSFKYGGYYSRNVTKALKVIALNSNFCARLNFWQLLKPSDFGYQLQWLVNELNQAEKSRQSVHIIGHIAPDKFQCNAIWLRHYLRILKRYNETIKAQFFGHTHFDEFRVYETKSDKTPLSMAYIGGSLTTYLNVNPMFKVY